MFAIDRNFHTGMGNVVPLASPTAPTFASIFEQQPVETVQADSALFWEGDSATHIFEVVEGVLRVFKIISEGRRVITGFLFPGDIVGISFRDRYLCTAEAVTLSRIRRFSRASFRRRLNQDPDLRPKLYACLCNEIAAAQDQMVLLARKSAEERLCSFLLLLARRMPHSTKTVTVKLPMSRLDIADYLGLTIETVSRNITKLTARGAIVPKGRHGFQFKIETLSLLAGDEDADNNVSDSNGRQRLDRA